jgi:CRISPR-associated protein Cmr6
MRKIEIPKKLNGSHAGLILARYLPYAKKDDEKPTNRKAVYSQAQDAVKVSKTIYQLAFERWQAALKDVAEMRTFAVDNRMIVGLGTANVLEAGITLHQTYGVPYIPGSALKGLAAHHVLEKENVNAKKRDLIFGKTDESGMVQFYDAWIEPDSLNDCLLPDIMTPHHSSYYENKNETPPSEFDSPTPIQFLSVTGTFCVALSVDDQSERGKQWLDFVWKLLGEALEQKGIGGKTNSGYGFGELEIPLPPPPPPKKEYQQGDTVQLTRLTKKEAQVYGKDLLFKDEDGNLCIVKKDNEKSVKEKAQPGTTINLAFVSKQTQNGTEFYQFRLPDTGK